MNIMNLPLGEHIDIIGMLEDALSSDDPGTVEDWISIDDGTMDQYKLKPTMAQVERGMTSSIMINDLENGDYEKWDIAAIWIDRADYKATEKQILSGLSHEKVVIRRAWARRSDYVPTEEQITAGLTDETVIVKLEWVQRPDIIFSEHQVDLMIGYFEKYEPLPYDSFDTLCTNAAEMMNNRNISLTPLQIDRVMKSSYYLQSDNVVRDLIRRHIATMFNEDTDPVTIARKRHSL